MDYKVSVIVPGYNVAPYIRQCLNSLVRQSFKEIQVIMIDDGSTDARTGQIMDEYADTYGNFETIHQANMGLGAARNVGVSYARGQYLAFVDSDDYVDSDAYEKMYAMAEQTHSDIVSGGVRRFHSSVCRDSFLHRMAIIDTCRKTHITKHPELLYDTTAWNKIYKKSFWDNYHLSFPENMLYEDIPLTIPAHFLAKSVDILEDPVYYWRIREGIDLSITQRRTDIQNFKDRLKALHLLDIFLAEHNVSKQMVEANQLKYLMNDFSVFLGVLKSVDSTYISKFQELMSNELAKMNPQLFDRIPAKFALAYRLVLQNKMDDAIKVMGVNEGRNLNFKPYREKGHWYQKFTTSEYTRKHPICVDESLNAVARIHRIRWDEAGRLEITGHAYIEGIDSGRKADVQMDACLINMDNQQQTDLPVLLLKETAITRKWGTKKIRGLTPLSRVYNYNWSFFSIKVDAEQSLNRIGEGRWTVFLNLNVQGMKKTVRLGAPLKGSNKANYRLLHDVAFAVKYNGKWLLAIDVYRPDVLIDHVTAGRNSLIFDGRMNRAVSDICLFYYDHGRGEKLTYVPEIHYSNKSRFSITIPDQLTHGPTFNETGWVIGYHLPGYYVPSTAAGMFAEKILSVHIGKRDVWIENIEGKILIYASAYCHPVLNRLEFTDNVMIMNMTLPERYNPKEGENGESQLLFEPVGNAPSLSFDLSTVLCSCNGKDCTIRLNCFDESGHFRWYSAGKWNVFVQLTDKNNTGKAGHKVPVILSKELLRTFNARRPYRHQRIRFSPISGRHLSLNFRTEISRHFMDRTSRRRKLIQWYLYPLMRLLPLKKNVIVFESFWGKSFGDNPKAIYDYIEHVYGNHFHYIWFMNNDYTPVTGRAKAVRKYSFLYFYYFARGKYFVENTTFPNLYVKRRGQIEMQTLHGTFMKKMGLDETVTFNTKYEQTALLKRSGRWDYLISPSHYMTEVSTKAYLFERQIVPCGFPKNDQLYKNNNSEYIKSVKEKLHLPLDKKVILYAPTFRSRYQFEIRLDLAMLQQRLSSDYVLLLRLHYFVTGRTNVEPYKGFVFDVSPYPDIQDLYLVSDVMITDYSSVMFDYAHLKRPMLFFAYDLDYYRRVLRGIYLNYEKTVPGPIVSKTEEVIRAIRELSGSTMYQQKYRQFYDKYCTYGRGESSKKAAEYLLNRNIKLQSGEHYYRNLWKKKINKWYIKLFKCIGKMPRKNIVLFESYFGRQYSDNPRAIYEYMKANHPEYRLIWNVQKGEEALFKREKIPFVIKYSFRGLWQWARAKYWVTNSRWPLWLPKPQNTVYIQTWHGTPLKTLGVDIHHMTMPGMTIERYKKEFTEESRKWDYCIAPNEYSSKIFQKAFEVQGAMINSGYPRNDMLIQKNTISDIMKIKKKMGIDRNKKVILYAPTWRDNEYSRMNHYTYDMKLDLARMKNEFGSDAVLLLRLHYLIADRLDLSGYEDFVKDVSEYEDCRELYLVADCLVTDYSSAFFDYANLKRPIVFYAYDLYDYANEIRGFYLDFEKEAPGPVVRDMDHLLPAIHDALNFTGDNPYPEFYKRFCNWEDGHSSRRAVEAFLKGRHV
ncbi:bifunctional glycosyltransferase/CDP-glycerol:glycerophosphate glycerophosphotransferase [Sporolactobacillus pectinivorans]|uniref:bifunctional glycosyltransferase/CDP-glycerol:glycerophosphate glycerophosphotransferase n=1 Tax=Sporolactobacillus pectinivorans TaxID=1591408 RepID=UPI000C258D97|nr:bifunctional glycosyltransferase/CDP-glycerol:glycerophosphate glycerophosphotransferase [Sporolactobacillus pectinivorans]